MMLATSSLNFHLDVYNGVNRRCRVDSLVPECVMLAFANECVDQIFKGTTQMNVARTEYMFTALNIPCINACA